MTRTDRKIISIFLLLIMIIAQLSTVFAADYAEQETTKTLTQYLIENGVDGNEDGVLSDAEWAKVKNLELTNIDLTGIEKAVNLKNLELDEVYNLGNVDFSKFTKLEYLYLRNITLTDDVQNNIGKATNLKSLSLLFCNNYTKINYSKLQKLTDLYIYGCNNYSDDNELVFPKMPKLRSLDFGGSSSIDIDLTNLDNIEYLYLTNDGKVKFPKFKNLEMIEVSSWGSNVDVDVDGTLDLSSCLNLYYGALEINRSKLVLHDKLLCTYVDYIGIILNTFDSEIKIMQGDSLELASGTSVYELVQNDDDNVATFEVYCYDGIYSSNDKCCEIIAKNVGTTNMKIKDALGREATLKIEVIEKSVNNNVDTSLENTGVTAKFINDFEKILKSNGELWEVNSFTTAEKIETNVKDYVEEYVGVQGTDSSKKVRNLLKNDGKLIIEFRDTVKEVTNVKQVEANVYLTNDGKLYELGLNYITEEINPKLIKENVKKLINNCIVLEDGTTWYQYIRYDLFTWTESSTNVIFKKLADFEIKDMDMLFDLANPVDR